MLNPTFSGGGTATVPRIARVYLGSQVLTASGTWSKAAALAQAFLADADIATVEVDIECIGGGAAGDSNHQKPCYGGRGARPQWLRAVRFDDLPDSAAVVVGSGGAATRSPGGASSFADLVLGPGGTVANFYVLPSPDDGWDGPGNGAHFADHLDQAAQNGGRSRPKFVTHAGNFGRRHGNRDGESASSPFGYGAGGANSSAPNLGGGNGGAGGSPGGGGGVGNSTSFQGGRGGNGAVRLHYYSYRSL